MMDRLQKTSYALWGLVCSAVTGSCSRVWGCIMKMLTRCECWFMHCQCSAVGLPVDKDGVNDKPLGTA